jgi:hypothetical protein
MKAGRMPTPLTFKKRDTMKTEEDTFENRYICEARRTGKKSHEFPTPSSETAQAMCDANGWEFIRIYEPGSHADKPAAKPQTGDAPLSALQLKCLVTEARKTYNMLTEVGAISETFDAWRHEVVSQTVRREGLKMCQSSHYRKLLSAFRGLRGLEDPADSGKSRRQSREGGDTGERREQLIHLLSHELTSHAQRVQHPQTPDEEKWAAHASSKGGAITGAYLLSIARAKNAGTPLHDAECYIKLTSARLEELLFTLRNRIAAREGRGTAAGRNKKQGGKDT